MIEVNRTHMKKNIKVSMYTNHLFCTRYNNRAHFHHIDNYSSQGNVPCSNSPLCLLNPCPKTNNSIFLSGSPQILCHYIGYGIYLVGHRVLGATQSGYSLQIKSLHSLWSVTRVPLEAL